MHDLRYALGLAVALLAVPAPAAGAVMRAAGWHAREIRAPYPRVAAQPAPQLPPGWSAGPVRQGTGYGRPSQRVRELQRRLLRRGYRPGPVDGRFGPRTRAAVMWFQIKHGLARTGRGDAQTLARLRDPRRPVRPAPAAAPVPAVAAAVTTPATAGGGTLATILLVLVILIGLAVILAWVRQALRPRAEAQAKPPARLAIAPAPSAPTVLGYAALAKGEDLEAAVRVIGAWCEARGWTLSKVVHDALPARGRPGLQHALDEVRAGRAAGVIVERLHDLTGSVTELGPLLQWFVDADAFVIALDYELDLSSRSGEIAARALVEISDWERGRVATRRGVASGAAVRDDPELSARITAMRSGGMSLQAIADALNEAGVPTLRGGSRWRPSSVQAATGYKRPPARTRGVDEEG